MCPRDNTTPERHSAGAQQKGGGGGGGGGGGYISHISLCTNNTCIKNYQKVGGGGGGGATAPLQPSISATAVQHNNGLT